MEDVMKETPPVEEEEEAIEGEAVEEEEETEKDEDDKKNEWITKAQGAHIHHLFIVWKGLHQYLNVPWS